LVLRAWQIALTFAAIKSRFGSLPEGKMKQAPPVIEAMAGSRPPSGPVMWTFNRDNGVAFVDDDPSRAVCE
jgi:hypothetical protein